MVSVHNQIRCVRWCVRETGDLGEKGDHYPPIIIKFYEVSDRPIPYTHTTTTTHVHTTTVYDTIIHLRRAAKDTTVGVMETTTRLNIVSSDEIKVRGARKQRLS